MSTTNLCISVGILLMIFCVERSLASELKCPETALDPDDNLRKTLCPNVSEKMLKESIRMKNVPFNNSTAIKEILKFPQKENVKRKFHKSKREMNFHKIVKGNPKESAKRSNYDFSETNGRMKKRTARRHRKGNSFVRHKGKKLGKVSNQDQRMNKTALRLLSGSAANVEGGGAFPPLFNIAPRARVIANATCGQNGQEEYCKLIDAYPHTSWAMQCGICDNLSFDSDRQHPIENIVDGSNKWWQSPTLQNGHEYEYVTVVIDLKQVYEVFFIMLKAAISPRPAAWILEKSLDNKTYEPWQYFGLSDSDCRRRYNMPGQNGKYIFKTNTEVICTTQFSKPLPLENGEIHISLLKNRPGAMDMEEDLMDFITTRFIRIRFQGMHSIVNAENSVGWLLNSTILEKRSFYSLRQVRISGRLFCHGHANKITEVIRENYNDFQDIYDTDEEDSFLQCICVHNTCGNDCSECCPSYNKFPFRNGTLQKEHPCQKCECNGHSSSCVYDENIGSVCVDCKDFTTGSHCEKCLPNHYRSSNVAPTESCQSCDCYPLGTAACDTESGICYCKEGFTGDRCDFCKSGYYGDECVKCRCDKRGVMSGSACDENCECKSHVEGEICSQCRKGYFALRSDIPNGCLECFCSGVSSLCKSASVLFHSIETLDDWKVTDFSRSMFAYPTFDEDTKNLIFGMFDLPDAESVYWQAPKDYIGNRLKSYGSNITIKASWVVIRGDTSGKPTKGPDVIIIGNNGKKIAYGDEEYHSVNNLELKINLKEIGWYQIPPSIEEITLRGKTSDYHGDSLTRAEFMSILSSIKEILIRATFHADQVESVLEKVKVDEGEDSGVIPNGETSLVEECICPTGYTGLSCEKCDFGYMRINENSSSTETTGECVSCPCNGHAETCNIKEGTCGICQHNTFGERCEFCKAGYYGNPLKGTVDDCKKCACPLTDDSNNFSPTCQLKSAEEDEYVCRECPPGYIGHHCELCDDGYYGDPNVIGSKCLPCPCSGGPCDSLTGECITCKANTEGWKCERCKTGFWGNPLLGCEQCDCYAEGSLSDVCDPASGQCPCKERFSGKNCDKCDLGFVNIEDFCVPCDCNVNGSINSICDPISGDCTCAEGVHGIKCDKCLSGYFGLNASGCEGKQISKYIILLLFFS